MLKTHNSNFVTNIIKGEIIILRGFTNIGQFDVIGREKTLHSSFLAYFDDEIILMRRGEANEQKHLQRDVSGERDAGVYRYPLHPQFRGWV